MASVDKSLAVGKIGELRQVEIMELNEKLKQLFQLD